MTAQQLTGDIKRDPNANRNDILLNELRQILWQTDKPKVVREIFERVKQQPIPKRASLKHIRKNALMTVAQWRLTGDITPNYNNVNEARIQMWEIEHHCPIFEFQKAFTARISRDFPSAPGPREVSQIYQSLDHAMPTKLLSPEDGIAVIRRPNANRTFLVFPGLTYLVSNLSPYLWDKVIAQPLNANVIACFDTSKRLFLGGIDTVGNRSETVSYIRNLLYEFRDTKVTAIGGSAGVFAALHASCDLGIEHIVATSGTTSLQIGLNDSGRQVYTKLFAAADRGEVELVDLVSKVSDSKIKRVDFFVGKQNKYDMDQMLALHRHSDVVVPHLYDSDAHNIIVPAIVDGSYMKAIKAMPA